jgi:hypothetical protein
MWYIGPTLKAEVPSMRCSPAAPLVVIAKRSFEVLPFWGVRNIFVVVLLPKSKIRLQLAVELSLTHVSIVQLLNVLTSVDGKLTYCCEVDASVNWPLENVPPAGKVPAHTGPPIESETIVPLVSLKL